MILTSLPAIGAFLFCTWPGRALTRKVEVLSAHGTWVKVVWEGNEDVVPYDWLHTEKDDLENHA